MVQARNMSRLISISIPARLHVNLFDLSEHGYRQNGGVGFCINGFNTLIKFKVSQEFEVVDKRSNGLTATEINSLVEHLQGVYRVNDFSEKMAIEFISGPPPHSGFGTGTATKLACVEAASIFNNIEINQAQLVSASGRGGTSGVGINTYFQGGLSIDFGVKASGLPLAPSSARTGPLEMPLQLLNSKLPASWEFGVIIPSDFNGISAKEEVDFFSKTCPISLSAVHESIYHAISGMACAAVENDYLTFSQSINAIQDTEWKKAEWSIQPDLVHKLRNELKDLGVGCVGLSSLGPALYFMSNDLKGIINKIQSSDEYIAVQCSPNNYGREIEVD